MSEPKRVRLGCKPHVQSCRGCSIAVRPPPAKVTVPVTVPLPDFKGERKSDARHLHVLVLTPSPYGKLGFTCDGCAQNGAGASFHCAQCKWDLHQACVGKGIVDKRHPHPLTLTDRPYGKTLEFTCDSCGQNGAGASFHCKQCQYDLHPKCVQAPSTPAKVTTTVIKAGGGEAKGDAKAGAVADAAACSREGQCMIGVADLPAAAEVVLRFALQIMYRPEFASRDYLLRCRVQYLRFLQLQAQLNARRKATDPPVHLVPTSGIDVWWQAHLIRPTQYRAFCLAQFGGVVDRDVIASDPARKLDETVKLWREEYNELYIDPIPTLEDMKAVDVTKLSLKFLKTDGDDAKKAEPKGDAKGQGSAAAAAAEDDTEPGAAPAAPAGAAGAGAGADAGGAGGAGAPGGPAIDGERKEKQAADGKSESKQDKPQQQAAKDESDMENLVTVREVIADRDWLLNLKHYTGLDDNGIFEEKFLAKCFDKYKKFLYLIHHHGELAEHTRRTCFGTRTRCTCRSTTPTARASAAGSSLTTSPGPEITDKAELAKQARGRDVWQEVFGEPIW